MGMDPAALNGLVDRSKGQRLAHDGKNTGHVVDRNNPHVISKRDLERHLQRHGCELLRQGSRHEVWWNRSTTRTSVPRHREIPLPTARAICRQLGVEPP